MRSIDNVTYLSHSDYVLAIDALRKFTKRGLRSLSEKSPDDLKDKIIGNFIARGTACLDSINVLWGVGNYQDCWVLHRALVDRLLLLRHLFDNDEFEEFERWSFQSQWWSADVAFSDPVIARKIRPEMLKEAKRLHKKRRALLGEKSQWHRPKAKEVAKEAGLLSLYRLAYDYPSTKVHPMADDGEDEFHTLLGLPSKPLIDDNQVVLHNSIAIQFQLVKYGLYVSTVSWRNFVWEFLDDWHSFLHSGSHLQLLKASMVFESGPDISWCEPQDNNANPDEAP